MKSEDNIMKSDDTFKIIFIVASINVATQYIAGNLVIGAIGHIIVILIGAVPYMEEYSWKTL